MGAYPPDRKRITTLSQWLTCAPPNAARRASAQSRHQKALLLSSCHPDFQQINADSSGAWTKLFAVRTQQRPPYGTDSNSGSINTGHQAHLCRCRQDPGNHEVGNKPRAPPTYVDYGHAHARHIGHLQCLACTAAQTCDLGLSKLAHLNLLQVDKTHYALHMIS